MVVVVWREQRVRLSDPLLLFLSGYVWDRFWWNFVVKFVVRSNGLWLNFMEIGEMMTSIWLWSHLCFTSLFLCKTCPTVEGQKQRSCSNSIYCDPFPFIVYVMHLVSQNFSMKCVKGYGPASLLFKNQKHYMAFKTKWSLGSVVNIINQRDKNS